MMAASSISMPAATAASSTSSTSVRLHHHHYPITTLSFDYSATTITLAAETKPRILQFKTTPNTHLPLLSIPSHSLRCRASDAAFDSFEDSQSQEFEEEDEDEDDDDDDEEEEEDEQQEPSPAPEGRRLYVGNLPYAMTSSQLTEVFGEAGRVEAVEIVYDRVTDRSRGFAFVTMGSFEEAKEAIRMFDGSQVGGRSVKVNFPEVPRGGEREVMGPKIRSSYRGFVDSPYKIYAGNLGWGLNSQGLRDAFADQPGLLSAKVLYDRDSGRSRGFGFVSFASEEEAESAINAMNGVEVEGRPLRLNMAAERATTGTPQRQETKSDMKEDIRSNAIQSSISAY